MPDPAKTCEKRPLWAAAVAAMAGFTPSRTRLKSILGNLEATLTPPAEEQQGLESRRFCAFDLSCGALL